MSRYKTLIIVIITTLNLGALILNFVLFSHNTGITSKNITKPTQENKHTTTATIDTPNTSSIPQYPMTKDETIRRDYFYKMFYGKWKISKIAGVNMRWGDDGSSKKLVGQTIEYSYENIKVNDVVKLNNPMYYTILAPIKPDFQLVEYLPTIGDLGLEGKYFACIYVDNAFDISENLIGESFYIKDDSTLIMFEHNVYYELKRISRIEDPIIALPG